MLQAPDAWGFTAAADRQRIQGCLCRDVRAGYRCVDTCKTTAAQMVEDSNNQLLGRVRYDNFHVLQPPLPNRRTYFYTLRDRRHGCSLCAAELKSPTGDRIGLQSVLYDN